MSDELVARLRTEHARNGGNGAYAWQSRELCGKAADRIEILTAEVQRLDYSTTHTCWDECPRVPCAQRREIEALTTQLARAKQECWNAAIEAAAAHLERDDGYGEWWEAAATIRALAMPDPVRAADYRDLNILRDKLRDYVPLADSDGDDGA